MTAQQSSPAQSAAPQDIRVGVIGVGRMGADHVERIARRTKGARVSVVSDYLRETAEKVSATAPGSRVVDTWQEVVAAEDVDAVLIASPGQFHREQVLACIAAGKPVLCEKPLAMNPSDAYDVVLAEREAGHPVVSLGFMRRFDAGYGELKDALEAGDLGTPLLLNCKHRNADVLPGFTDTHMVYDSAVHEIDAISFFLEEPAVSVQTVMPRSTEKAPEGLHDPLLFLFRTASGTVVTDELWVSTDAGYEVRTELVGSLGAATIGQESGLVTTQQADGRWGGTVPADFRPRFAAAYDAEVQAWIAAVADGSNVAPRSATAWDGYVAAAMCEAAEQSLTADGPVEVTLLEQPA
ncbi:inositol 2-dehydrogenase [Brachybacterium ginsengisoli]|uniref:Inositol 2-dehydrogenase n=1 Tax=Brachybacterium ginsengisoli TaxID=1331682 RepID=A0A291H1A5_9MICO|nr:Gfo/Idh/MocA family oxidoreductase [Brachybacterium ginsengisoli]ATG56268.1 inositol 2-dehydrogenase [Brachybacterium ginsengisoli]